MLNIPKYFNKTYEYTIILIVLVIIAIIIISNVFVVGPSEEAIVLRLGRLNRTLESEYI